MNLAFVVALSLTVLTSCSPRTYPHTDLQLLYEACRLPQHFYDKRAQSRLRAFQPGLDFGRIEALLEKVFRSPRTTTSCNGIPIGIEPLPPRDERKLVPLLNELADQMVMLKTALVALPPDEPENAEKRIHGAMPLFL